MKKFGLFFFIGLLFLLMPFMNIYVKADSPQYTITDLGVLHGTILSQAFGINDNSQIVGRSSNTESVDDRAFLWQNGQMVQLPDLGSTESIAHKINISGQIVGMSTYPTGTHSAVLWQNGQLLDLGALSPSASNSEAFGINDSSQIIGKSNILVDGKIVSHPFSWKNGVMTDLTAKDATESVALNINNNDQIVGQETQPFLDFTHLVPVLWESGNVILLGSSGGNPSFSSYATAINNQRQIVGVGTNNHGFLWENNTFTDLGTLGGEDSFAQDINDQGQIVGGSRVSNGSDIHAFIWQNGSMTDLGTLPGGTNSSANAINSKGQIVGYSFTASGSAHAVLWSPIEPSPTPTNTPTPTPTLTSTPTPTLIPSPTISPTQTPTLTPTPTVSKPPHKCTVSYRIFRVPVVGFIITIPVINCKG